MIAPAPPIVAALAREHEAGTLAAALAARLLADGRSDLPAAVAALLDEASAIDPNPPDPHRVGAGDAVASLSPNPPDPHREGSAR